MGLQIYVGMERVTADMVLGHTQGKDLSRASLVDEGKVLAPLWAFSSVTAAQLAELREMDEEDQVMQGHPLPTVEWFDAAPALDAVRQVRRDLAACPDAFGAQSAPLEGVMEDLASIEQELGQAVKFGVRVHLIHSW